MQDSNSENCQENEELLQLQSNLEDWSLNKPYFSPSWQVGPTLDPKIFIRGLIEQASIFNIRS